MHQEKDVVYGLGVTDCKTQYGNIVKIYDSERCICDIINNREKYDIQLFQTAMKEYMRRKDKNLNRLIKYAEALKMRKEVMKYVEVMI